MTHSLKVEQVGFSLYNYLFDGSSERSETSLHAIEAACLAHDLGHAPFGHAGEAVLDTLVTCDEHRKNPRTYEDRLRSKCDNCSLEDGFEGNAQTFRLLTALEQHRVPIMASTEPTGLDLTRISLAAVSKYPWLRGAKSSEKVVTKAKKWGAYDCDRKALEWVTGDTQARPSPEAEVMDWADDISYAVHDIEDFYRAGLVPLDDYSGGSTDTIERFFEYVEDEKALGKLDEDYKTQFSDLLNLAPEAQFSNTGEQSGQLDIFRSKLITTFVNSASLSTSKALDVAPHVRMQNSILKQLTWFHIIDEPRLVSIHIGQGKVLKDIYEALLEPVYEAYGVGKAASSTAIERRRLPPELNRAIAIGLNQQDDSGYTLKEVLNRGILDYIASLSDAGAYSQHAVIKGRAEAGYLV